MKKLLLILSLLLCLCGCEKKPDYSKPYDLFTYSADMVGYNGLESNDHNFLGTTVSELKRLIEEKGYGVFVLSSTFCPHCKIAMQYLNEVSKELNVKVFYLDGTSKEYPIVDSEDYDVLFNLLYDILEEGAEGKDIQTPHVFSLIDGKFVESQVGTTWQGLDYSEKDIENLKERYREILKPFSSQSQD